MFYFPEFNTLPDVSFSHAEESSFIEFGFMLALTGQTINSGKAVTIPFASYLELQYPK